MPLNGTSATVVERSGLIEVRHLGVIGMLVLGGPRSASALRVSSDACQGAGSKIR